MIRNAKNAIGVDGGGTDLGLVIYYDGECPFCTRYVTMLRLKRTGDVNLVDLRTAPHIRDELTQEGFDLDQGMVVDDQGKRRGGADAVAYLGTLSTPSDVFNRLNRVIFARPVLANILYPILRSGRWLTLFLLGRRMIEDGDDASRARREIFATFFALFSIFHFFNYVSEYRRFPPSLDLVLVLIAAFAALFRPSSARLLFGLVLVSSVSTIVQAPVSSNHTMVRSAALLGYWLSFLVAMARNGPVSSIFERFAPAGCGALLVMYFFGIFHKINADFLDPATSCAMALWRQMPRPLSLLDGPVIEFGAIYGTFAVEGLIALALLTRRLRHVGIASGMVFHLLLSLSSYAMYISFTMLAIALHTLFLTETAARSVLDSPLVTRVRAKLAEPIYKLLVAGLALWLAIFAFAGHYTFASIAVFPLILPFCWAVLRHGRQQGPFATRRGTLIVGAVTTTLFFINCAMPYMGLKTAQAGNMFANLRLENGKSNHLVFSSPKRPFDYLNDVAVITEFDGRPIPVGHSEHRMGIVFYDLLDWMGRHPEVRLSFEMGSRTYTNVGSADLGAEMKILHPPWFRKFFHFRPVYLGEPQPCTT